MGQDSQLPKTIGEWTTLILVLVAMGAAAIAAIAASGFVAQLFGLTGELARWILFVVAMLLIGGMFHRPFWVLAFALGALCAFIAMAAHIVHFQILPAFGFAVLALALGGVTAFLVRRYG